MDQLSPLAAPASASFAWYGPCSASRPMLRLALGLGLSVVVAGAIIACGSSRLPAPVYVGQETGALQQADYPPPPARVEFVPKSPKDGAVWLDGEWTWQGQRWAWKSGRWVAPPANAKFSPWTATRGQTGIYYVAEGTWKDSAGQDLPDPPALAVGRVRGGGVVNPEGEDVPQTPNVRPERTTSGADNLRDAAPGPPETPSGATPTGTEPKRDAGSDSVSPP